MKQRIEEKLERNIERILEKEELTPSDVAILKEKLSDIKFEETREEDEEKRKQLMEMLINTNSFAKVN
jgi:hypothetical protein